jgi:hypothetical protein
MFFDGEISSSVFLPPIISGGATTIALDMVHFAPIEVKFIVLPSDNLHNNIQQRFKFQYQSVFATIAKKEIFFDSRLLIG